MRNSHRHNPIQGPSVPHLPDCPLLPVITPDSPNKPASYCNNSATDKNRLGTLPETRCFRQLPEKFLLLHLVFTCKWNKLEFAVEFDFNLETAGEKCTTAKRGGNSVGV